MTAIVDIFTRHTIYLPDNVVRKPRKKTKEEEKREQHNNRILAELKIVPGSGNNKSKY